MVDGVIPVECLVARDYLLSSPFSFVTQDDHNLVAMEFSQLEVTCFFFH